MSRLKIGIGAVLALGVVLAMVSTATAGSVGKVTGRVTDERGGPLPGANVVLEGTQRGATTDTDGSYVILSIDPGVYSATASMVGYHLAAKERVIVQVDLTTTVDFRLREEALKMEEMVVVAERPAVEPDKTESRYVVSFQDIQRVPILRNVGEFMEMEAGMAVDGSGQIRSGMVLDNAYYVDGVRLVNNDVRGMTGTPAARRPVSWFAPTAEVQWSGVNVKAVQELSLITGGMNAEYGNASAGVVQMVTRDGGNTYHGEVEYRLTPAGKKHWGKNVYDSPEHRGRVRWDDPEWVSEVDPVTGRLVHQRKNYTDWRGHYFDGHFSGPITRSASFFGSARHNRDAAPFPNTWDEYRPFNFRTTAKLTVSATPNVKARFGWVFDRWKTFELAAYRNILWGAGLTRETENNVKRGPGRDIFLPAGSSAGQSIKAENVLYAVLTHTIGPRTFYELRVSNYQSKQDTSGVSDNTSAEIRTDKANWFYLGYDNASNYTVGEQNRLGLKFDLSSQVTKGHFVKAGIDFTRYDNYYVTQTSSPGNKTRAIVYLGPEPGAGVKPKQFAVYAQDKMEFEGLVINAGMRFDRFWGPPIPIATGYRQKLYNSLHRFLQAPRFPMEPIVNWSPRLGISHPITDRSKMHFSYGVFNQVPSFQGMFQDNWRSAGPPTEVKWSNYTGNSYPGDASVTRPIWQNTPRMINFEVGGEWNFVSDYTASMATFIKSGTFQVTFGGGAWFDPKTAGLTYGTGYPTNSYAHDVRGYEFSLRKDFSHQFSFRAAFNMDWMEFSYGGNDGAWNGSTLIPDSTYVASGNYHTSWEIVGGVERPVKLTDAEIREIGAQANVNIAKVYANPQAYAGGWAASDIVKLWERPWLTDEERSKVQGLHMLYLSWRGTSQRTRGRGPRKQASLQAFFSSPTDFGPGPKMAGGTFLGGVNVNLIYRLYFGTEFRYTTIEGLQDKSRGPVHTTVDLNIQKRLHLGRVSADLFFEAFNLFQQRDAQVQLYGSTTTGPYMWWGLGSAPGPDDANYLKYGDPRDRERYRGDPRVTHLGIRLRF